MDIKILDKNKEKMSFILKGVDSVFVNTLRRLVIEEIPSLAIEDVTFVQNSSALYDEILAHRLGLIVLKTDLKDFDLKNLEKATNKIAFKLDVKGPGNVYSELRVKKNIYSRSVFIPKKDIKIAKKNVILKKPWAKKK